MKNKSKQLFILAFTILSLSACGRKQDDAPASSAPAPTPQPQAQAVSSCDVIKKNANKDLVSEQASEQSIKIERHFQRVVRKDCAGQTTSDQIETVKSLHYDLKFKAPKQKFLSVFVFNENSCDHKLTVTPVANFPLIGLLYSVTGDEKSILIKGDMANAALTFKLEEGRNDIFVRYFYDCSPSTVAGNSKASVGEGTCQESKDSLLVQYPVIVKYVETQLEGFREIKPSKFACELEAKKAQSSVTQ